MFEYVSSCCGVRALKPRAAQKATVVDAETKKSKAEPKGLGHWRCPNCRKACKVTRRKPEPEVVKVNLPATIAAGTVVHGVTNEAVYVEVNSGTNPAVQTGN